MWGTYVSWDFKKLEELKRKEELKSYLEHYNQPGHKRPISRRDFLSSGLIPFSAWMAAPSIITLLARAESQAQALNCPTPAQVSLVPFIHVNLSGGAALHANWVPRDRMGNPLASYDRMGLGTTPTLMQNFGGATFYNNDPNGAGLHSFFSSGSYTSRFNAGDNSCQHSIYWDL